ncbi:MAG: FKBP-type peptidyl-prolyl cis-trans isomerase [Desulfobacteraceae bacterium]|nr:FKBP-type peptidyl-prolyl cis-trans isomerase [Desulfobacteraceae bacterium]
MLRTIIALLTILITTTSFAADAPKTEEQKTFYAIGLSVSKSLSVFTLSPAELDMVVQGLTDGQSGKKTDVDVIAYTGKIQELARTRRKALGDKQSVAGQDFLVKAAKEKGATKTPSGMVFTSLIEGKGDSPRATDVVKVNYRGTLIDGKEFDSSYKRGKPLEFKLDNVIKCWVEGLQKMKPGGKAKFVCPPQLAYGDNGAGEMILPGATLEFEVELLEVKHPSEADTAPAKPAAPVKEETKKK